MKSSMRSVVILTLTMFAAGTTSVALADEHQATPTKGATPARHDTKEPVVVAPANYAEAVAAINERTESIEHLIKDGKLASLHVEAAVIKKIADGMSKLVAKPDSGVPESAWPEVLKASKALSGMFPIIDEAGDSGNVAASKKAHADLVTQVAVLKKYAPTKSAMMYACPMHADVTSATAGKCSKCGMGLELQGSAKP